MRLKRPLPVGGQFVGQLLAHGFAHRVDALRIDHVELLGDVGFRRQRQHQFLERGIQRRVAQHRTHGRQVGCIEATRRLASTGDGLDRAAQGQALAGFPAVERVGIKGQQREQLRVAVAKVHDHRGAETAQDRRHGFLQHVFERD